MNMSENSTAEGSRSTEGRLVRAIGPWALTANAINLTLGAGIFVMPATAAGLMGSSAIFGYLVCGLTMALVLACFAEVGSRVSGSGGAYAYVEAAFGPLPAFVVGTLLWFGYAAAADAAIAHVWFDNLAELHPTLKDSWLRPALIIAIIAACVGLNVVGLRLGVRVASIFTLTKLLPLLLLLAVGVPAVASQAATAVETPTAKQLGDGALVLFFVFAGAECALTPSGEIRDPKRTVPRALLIALSTLLVLFLGLQLVAQGVLGANLASHRTPLAAAAGELLGPTGRFLVVVGAIVSTMGTLVGDVLATPRAIYATALDGGLPKTLARVSPRFHTPVASIVLFGAVVCAFALTGAFRQLAALASASVLVIYSLVCLAALRLRYSWTGPLESGGFQTPGGPVVALLAIASVGWLLAHLKLAEWLSLGVFVALALAVYGLSRRRL